MSIEAIQSPAPSMHSLTDLDEKLVQAVCDGKSTAYILDLIDQGANVNVIMPSYSSVVEPKVPLWWAVILLMTTSCGRYDVAAAEKVLSRVDDIHVKVEGVSLSDIMGIAEKFLMVTNMLSLADYAADREMLEVFCDSQEEFDEDLLTIKSEAAEKLMQFSQVSHLLNR